MVKPSAGECTIRDGMAWRLPLLRRAFVGASIAWSLALPLATFASSGPHSSSLLYLVSLSTYVMGGVLCHQLPARSFFLWGSQMPVCARCTGIYLGAAVSALVAVAFAARLKPSRPIDDGRSRGGARRLQPSGIVARRL